MIQRLVGGIASERIRVEQMRQQILGRRTQVLGPAWIPQGKLDTQQFITGDGGGIIIKGQAAA